MAAVEVLIVAGTPESRLMGERIEAAIARCERLNRIPYSDSNAIRAAWSELTGQAVDESFRLVPPIRVDHGVNLRVGRKVFINHNCTVSDIGGVEIGDEVLIAPNVSLLSSGHPLEPFERIGRVTAAPIVIGRNAWLGAGAKILDGVTLGANVVIGAGAVVNESMPDAVIAAGVPAKIIRRRDGLSPERQA